MLASNAICPLELPKSLPSSETAETAPKPKLSTFEIYLLELNMTKEQLQQVMVRGAYKQDSLA